MSLPLAADPRRVDGEQPDHVLAITLWQPWASAAALGIKRWETRSWSTRHRGPLAVHAAASPIRPEGRALFAFPPVREAFVRHGIDCLDALPRGQVLAIVDNGAPVPTDVQVLQLEEVEISLGIYAPGRWAWPWTNLRRLERPVPAAGGQRLWRWRPPAALEALCLSR